MEIRQIVIALIFAVAVPSFAQSDFWEAQDRRRQAEAMERIANALERSSQPPQLAPTQAELTAKLEYQASLWTKERQAETVASLAIARKNSADYLTAVIIAYTTRDKLQVAIDIVRSEESSRAVERRLAAKDRIDTLRATDAQHFKGDSLTPTLEKALAAAQKEYDEADAEFKAVQTRTYNLGTIRDRLRPRMERALVSAQDPEYLRLQREVWLCEQSLANKIPLSVIRREAAKAQAAAKATPAPAATQPAVDDAQRKFEELQAKYPGTDLKALWRSSVAKAAEEGYADKGEEALIARSQELFYASVAKLPAPTPR